jgi:hypothetical protein
VSAEQPFGAAPKIGQACQTAARNGGTAQRRPVIRLGLESWHKDHGSWTLPCEIDLSADHDPRYAGWAFDVPQQ